MCDAALSAAYYEDQERQGVYHHYHTERVEVKVPCACPWCRVVRFFQRLRLPRIRVEWRRACED